MSVCQIEEREAGRSYPRTCPTCGLGGACRKGLDVKSLRRSLGEHREALQQFAAGRDAYGMDIVDASDFASKFLNSRKG